MTIEKLIYPKTDNAESAPLVKFYKGQLFAGAAPELKENTPSPRNRTQRTRCYLQWKRREQKRRQTTQSVKA